MFFFFVHLSLFWLLAPVRVEKLPFELKLSGKRQFRKTLKIVFIVGTPGVPICSCYCTAVD